MKRVLRKIWDYFFGEKEYGNYYREDWEFDKLKFAVVGVLLFVGVMKVLTWAGCVQGP